MLEQLKIQKQVIPQSPNSQNKLHQYFESSSFLLQQQELSVFIKELPIISLREIRNINSLISLLIKQNQLLGSKCQQQVNLLKQQYLKHQKLIKTNKQIKIDREKLQKQYRQIQDELIQLKNTKEKQMVKVEEFELIQRKFQAANIKNNAIISELTQKIAYYDQMLQHICQQEYKKCEQLIKGNFSQHMLSQKLQEYLQNTKRKNRYFGKIKNIVQQFCGRLQKVVKVVSPTLLASQLITQSNNMTQLIAQILDHEKGRKRRKKTQIQSQKHFTSNSQYGSNNQKHLGFFQNMLQKIVQSASNNNATKEFIAGQLQTLKGTLYQTKSNYENTLKKLKQQIKQKQQQLQKKINFKQETLKYYQQQIKKNRESLDNFKDENQLLNSSLITIQRQIQAKNLKIQHFQQKIIQISQQSQQNYQRIKSQCETRIQQIKKVSALKIEQREQLLNQLNERKRRQQFQYEQKISCLKEKTKQLQQQCLQKQKKLKSNQLSLQALQNQFQKTGNRGKDLQSELFRYKQQNAQVGQKLQRKNRQIQQFKQTLNSLQHEKKLQTAYIKQLQSKIQTLNNKIKALESKAKNEIQNKKQITSMKNTIVQQKQKSEQYQQYISQIKEQNQRLKSIVKQMKKQLQEVYMRLSDLKQIQCEREKLILEVQQTERAREGLIKQYQQMKFEMLKLQSENKKMHLQLKHFKNIIGRIKFVQQD